MCSLLNTKHLLIIQSITTPVENQESLKKTLQALRFHHKLPEMNTEVYYMETKKCIVTYSSTIGRFALSQTVSLTLKTNYSSLKLVALEPISIATTTKATLSSSEQTAGGL